MKTNWYERIKLAAVAFSAGLVFASVPAVSGGITAYAQETQSIENSLGDGKNTGEDQANNQENNNGTGIENNSENNTGNNSDNKEGIAPCWEEKGGDGISV